jgi:two-component system sensor histidine kinase VicK
VTTNSYERTEILYGEEKVTNATVQFLSKADRIDSCADHRAPSQAIGVESYKKLLFDLKSRGVKIRYITEITKENIQYCKEMTKFAEEVRHIDGLKANFSVSETEYIATTAAQQEEGQLLLPQVINSNVKDTVEQQQYIFENFWNRAVCADQKIREIEEGVDLGKTEIILNSYKTKELFISLVRSANDEILLILPTANVFYREEGIGVIKLLREATEKRGVNVKVLVPLSYAIEKILQTLETRQIDDAKQKNFEIRQIDLASEIKSTILVTDRTASLATELRNDTKENFVESTGLASYSTSKPTVLSYTSIFENFWIQTELYLQLKEANEKLKIHDKIQREFINIAAHELRSPIQPILGLSELLKSKEGFITQYKELLDVINRNAKRLKRLTADILDVAKIESELLTLRRTHFNLRQVILDTISDHKSQIANGEYSGQVKGKEVTLELRSDTNGNNNINKNILVYADEGRITQVLSNLLSNAIKFTPDGSITVMIEKRKNKGNDAKEINRIQEVEEMEVIVTVEDDGIGIDANLRSKLFEKFAIKSDKGMGLGLYISRRIIEAHEGRIWAENSPNRNGARFSFTLPLTRVLTSQSGIEVPN